MPIELGSIPANKCNMVVLPAMTSERICSGPTPVSSNSCSIKGAASARPPHAAGADHLGMRNAQLDSRQDVVAQADLGVQTRCGIHDFSGGQVDQHADHRRRADVHGDAEGRRCIVGLGRPDQPGIADLLRHDRSQRQDAFPLLQFRRRAHGQIVVALAGDGFTNRFRQRFPGRSVANRPVTNPTSRPSNGSAATTDRGLARR